MSQPPPAAPAAAPTAARRRPVDVLGIVAVCVAAVALLPTLALFLIGLIPEMNAIWWLGIIVIPIIGVVGALVVVLGIVGIIVAARRHGRFVLSVIGIVLGMLLAAPFAWLFLASAG
jgi:hypothetical protein